MRGVWSKPRKTLTTKHTETRNVGRTLKETLEGGLQRHVCFQHAIDEINRSGKGIWPKMKRDRGMMSEGETSLNYMAMTTLSETIMYWSVRRGGEMRNTMRRKKV